MSDIIKPLGQNKVWAENGVFVEPSDTKQNIGWGVERPPYQWENFLKRKITQTLASFNQKGFPTWDAETEYRANGSWILGSNGVVYYCKVTHTNQNPTTDLSESYWTPVLNGQKLLAASSVSSYMLTVLSAPNATQAQVALGSTSIGRAVFTAPSSDQAQSAIGGSPIGRSLFSAASQLQAQSALGGTTVGRAVFTAGSPEVARTALGISPFGGQLIEVANANTAKSVLQLTQATETNLGLVNKANNAEVNAGTDDTKYITPLKLKLGFSINLSASNGGITFPSWLFPLQIRWGSNSVGGGQSIFVTSFPTTCLAGTATHYSNNTSGGNGAMRCLPSGNNLTVVNPESSSRQVGWIAIGY